VHIYALFCITAPLRQALSHL